MKAYRLGLSAFGDLQTISGWIATNNLAAASRWLDDMDQLFVLLSTQPEMGEQCDQVSP